MEKGRRIQSTRNAGGRARAQFALSKVIPIIDYPEDPFADIDSEDDENNETIVKITTLAYIFIQC